jgi:hypothetical protein
MTSLDPHYHGLYKAIVRASHFLFNEGYTTQTINQKAFPFQIVASNGKTTRHIRILITPKGKLQNYDLILSQMTMSKLPITSKTELWVWEIRTGWHFYSPTTTTK